MWFKNLKIYRFTKPLGLSVERIEELLAAQPFQPLGKTSKHCAGWVTPAGESYTAYTHTVGDATMVCLREQSKILPSSAVNEALKEKAKEIEHKEGRKLYRKERDQLKDEIILDMLPRAFTKSKDTYAFFTESLLIINTGSNSDAEMLMHNLRQTLDGLPVAPISTKQNPVDILTQWVAQGHGSEDFAIGEEGVFFNPREAGSLIRCKRQDLQCDEIQAHLQAGMLISQLAFTWDDSVSGIIDQDLCIKRLKFGDVITGKAQETEAEDLIQQFDQDFAVMSVTILSLINHLINAMGGLAKRRQDIAPNE